MQICVTPSIVESAQSILDDITCFLKPVNIALLDSTKLLWKQEEVCSGDFFPFVTSLPSYNLDIFILVTLQLPIIKVSLLLNSNQLIYSYSSFVSFSIILSTNRKNSPEGRTGIGGINNALRSYTCGILYNCFGHRRTAAVETKNK